MTAAVFHAGMQCDVLALEYDFTKHTGYLQMEEGDCCDMGGCIAAFKRIDPDVKAIATYSGDVLDTCYRLHREDGWVARAPHEKAFMSNPPSPPS